MLFIDLRDGSSIEHLQVTVDAKAQPQIPAVAYGDAVIVSGEIGAAPRGHLELRADKLDVKGNAQLVLDALVTLRQKRKF